MECCIINPLNLGCFSTCETVNFGINATLAGTYTASFWAFGFWVKIQKAFATNELLIFPLSKLNERASYRVALRGANNQIIVPPLYDGFSIITVLYKSL